MSHTQKRIRVVRCTRCGEYAPRDPQCRLLPCDNCGANMITISWLTWAELMTDENRRFLRAYHISPE